MISLKHLKISFNVLKISSSCLMISLSHLMISLKPIYSDISNSCVTVYLLISLNHAWRSRSSVYTAARRTKIRMRTLWLSTTWWRPLSEAPEQNRIGITGVPKTKMQIRRTNSRTHQHAKIPCKDTIYILYIFI